MTTKQNQATRNQKLTCDDYSGNIRHKFAPNEDELRIISDIFILITKRIVSIKQTGK